VFENNGPALWAKVTSQISSFLSNLFSQGYFAGSNPSQAFFVICDSSNNTNATIEAGQLVIDIGVAPSKPAEFIRLRFQQKSLNS
jgi:phage tail sheath protein FI